MMHAQHADKYDIYKVYSDRDYAFRKRERECSEDSKKSNDLHLFVGGRKHSVSQR